MSAAIRAAQRGARVALVDSGPIGGTCLNRGCIPARALGTTARLMAQLRKAETYGVHVEGLRVDLAGVLTRKERILRRLRAGLLDSLKRSKVALLEAEGILQSSRELELKIPGKPSEGLRAQAVILATGSRPGSIPGCPIDGKAVITSDEILNLSRLPASLTVVGGGVIGSEFASYFADLGVSVTLIEAVARLLPSQDPAVSEAFARSLKRRGVSVLTETKVSGISRQSDGAAVTLSDGRTVSSELVLVAVGRVPRLPQGVEAAGLKLQKGGLSVDERLRTSVPGVFAIGDLLGGYQLAYTASYEGALAAENALGGSIAADYDAVPDTIYTEPEIASVGLTETEALERGKQVKVSRVPFAGFARALTLEETEGFAQLVSERSSGQLLGAQMIGARATDLIGEAALAVRHRLTVKHLVDTIHAHPTMSESLWEVAAIALERSIYYAVGER